MRRQGSTVVTTDQATAAVTAATAAVEELVVRIVYTGLMAVAVVLHDIKFQFELKHKSERTVSTILRSHYLPELNRYSRDMKWCGASKKRTQKI
jgi:hypothetical protein